MGEIADDRGIHGSKWFHAAPSIIRWHQACSPGVIECSLEIGEHPVGGGASPAHGFSILAVESGDVDFSGARAPASWPFRNRSVPLQQPPRG